MTDRTDLYERVATLRTEAFELLGEVTRADALEGEEVFASASAELQSIANHLGAVERLVGPPKRAAA